MILDTCALIWLATGSERLSAATRQRIQDAPVVRVSAISAFEVGHKYATGGLRLPCDAERWYRQVLEHHQLSETPIDGSVALLASRLPRIHKDPCDRLVIATAKLFGLTVVTADVRFVEYGVQVLC